MKKFLPISGIILGGAMILVGFFAAILETFVFVKNSHDLFSVPFFLLTAGMALMFLNAMGLAVAAVLQQAREANRHHKK